MAQIMTDRARVIIDDFAKEIKTRKTSGTAPSRGVINFREEKSRGIERDIYDVPITLLRYRKDNGRIASDVSSYEKTHLIALDERFEETQKVLYSFLKEKDPEKTDILKKAIKKDGQTEPAIITCDGFLINGNRRRMVLQILNEEEPSKYKTMKVIILPGRDDEGGPPTIKDIELLENRYQLQQDGKSEYTGIDRALSIKRKIECGITLEEQLQDDPSCSGMKLGSKEFNKVIKDYNSKYLLPLERVDAYLEILGRPGHYDSIENRWQAFIDFSLFYNGRLQEKSWQLKTNLSDDNIGQVQDIAFKIIRKQSVKGREVKLHQTIRQIPKFIENPDAKKSIFQIPESTKELTDLEKTTAEGREFTYQEQDRIWGNKNEEVFAKHINAAYSYLESQKEDENALSLIRGVLKKLNHSNMDTDKIPKDKIKEFMKEADKVLDRVGTLKSEVWGKMKNGNRE